MKPHRGRQRKYWCKVVDNLFSSLGLDKAEWLEDIQKGSCSLKSFLGVAGEGIDERESSKFEEGLNSIRSAFMELRRELGDRFEHFQSLDSFEKSSYVLGSEVWEEYSSGLLGLIKDFVLSVWEERKVRLYDEHANVHQSHSQNDSGDLRGVAGGDGELGCLAPVICVMAPPIHLGAWNGHGCLLIIIQSFLNLFIMLHSQLDW